MKFDGLIKLQKEVHVSCIHHFAQKAQCVHQCASGINKLDHAGFFIGGECKLHTELSEGVLLRVPIQTKRPKSEYHTLILSRNCQNCFVVHMPNL